MRPYSQQAFELKMGIEAGVVTSSEVISWADETLSKHDYDDDLANISMASEASPKDLIILIGQVVDCLLYTSPSPRDQRGSRMPSSA